MREQKNFRALFTGMVLFFSTLPPLVAANGLDPLDPSEVTQAITLNNNGLSSTRTLSLDNITAPSEPELLLVERHPTAKGQTQRLADVFTYDYQTNETVRTVIDLTTNRVTEVERQQNLQLPLTEKEIQRTFELVFNDDEERNLLNTEFQRITGQQLTNPQQQLEIKAFVFHASSLPEQLNTASEQCGLHRCAQVLLYTADSVVFEVSPIVNLSAGVITQNIGF